MPNIPGRFADTVVMAVGEDPATGLSGSELTFTMPANLLAAAVDTNLIQLPASRIKTLVIVVTTAITSAAAQQFTVQLFAARTRYGVLGSYTATAPWGTGALSQPTTPFSGGSGATFTFPTSGPNACQLIGVPVNFFTSGTSIPVGTYWFTSTSPGTPGLGATASTSLTELAQWYPVLGVEIKAPAAPTAGSYQIFLEVAPL